MSIAEILQIIIGIASVVATIVVSASIHWLQRKHENELKIRELSEKAEQFIFDNEDERDYLPWCVFASNLHRHEKHTRKIYTNFCRCTETLQNEILKQANFSIRVINNSDWFYNSIECLRYDIKKYKLGRDVLYEGAKYFRYAFDYYRNEKMDDEKYIFDPIFSIPFLEKCDFSKYVEQYLRLNTDDGSSNYEMNNAIPPIDYVWYAQDLSNCEDGKMCKWVVTIVEGIVVNLNNIKKPNWNDSLFLDLTDAQIETVEDAYLQALTWLYYTYILDKEVDKKESIET